MVVTMDGVQLKGAGCRSKRIKLYEFMMEDLVEEQRIQVTAKLVQDILSNALDYSLLKLASQQRPSTTTSSSSSSTAHSSSSTSSALEDVLEDTLLILQSPLLKIGKKSNANDNTAVEEDLMDELNGGAACNTQMDTSNITTVNVAAVAATRAKTKVLKTISRQHLVNHVLPVVMSLKHALETVKSPLQGVLMDYLVHLMQAHKAEVEETLNADPTLKAEIEYDLKMYERQKRQQAVEAQQQQQAQLQQLEADAAVAVAGSKTPLHSHSKSANASARKSLENQLKRLSFSHSTAKKSLLSESQHAYSPDDELLTKRLIPSHSSSTGNKKSRGAMSMHSDVPTPILPAAAALNNKSKKNSRRQSRDQSLKPLYEEDEEEEAASRPSSSSRKGRGSTSGGSRGKASGGDDDDDAFDNLAFRLLDNNVHANSPSASPGAYKSGEEGDGDDADGEGEGAKNYLRRRWSVSVGQLGGAEESSLIAHSSHLDVNVELEDHLEEKRSKKLKAKGKGKDGVNANANANVQVVLSVSNSKAGEGEGPVKKRGKGKGNNSLLHNIGGQIPDQVIEVQEEIQEAEVINPKKSRRTQISSSAALSGASSDTLTTVRAGGASEPGEESTKPNSRRRKS